MLNFAENYKKGWLVVKEDYLCDNYYFHSFVYRFLSVYAWIKKIQSEMIFLDTTISTKSDLEFIKFLRVFPELFCDLILIEGEKADGRNAVDHFFKNEFELFPDIIICEKGIISFSEYRNNLTVVQNDLLSLFNFFDGITPEENRKRWDRLHLLNLTIIIFLNNYGYDFQRTDDNKIDEAIKCPKISKYLKNYFNLLNNYRLGDNKEVLKLKNRTIKKKIENIYA
jgi:hypothetical protein